jgi:hypothetical protein
MHWFRRQFSNAAITLLVMFMGCASQLQMSDVGVEIISNGTFEANGEPTYKGWRVSYPAFVGFSAETPKEGGRWSLGISAGRVFMPISHAHSGETYRFSAWVKSVQGGAYPTVFMTSGPQFPGTRSYGGKSTNCYNWSKLTIEAKVNLNPGDSLWVELDAGSGGDAALFDNVSLQRIDSLTEKTPSLAIEPMASRAYGQAWMNPSPAIGWDSLYRRIAYPSRPLRGGLDAVVWTRIIFRWDGQIDSIQTAASVDPASKGERLKDEFSIAVKEAFRSTPWSVADGCNRGWYSIPVYFFVNNSAVSHRIFVGGEMSLEPSQPVYNRKE